MPISADPNRAAWYSLELQPDKQFLCRFMTLREHQKISDLLASANKCESEQEAEKILSDVIAIGVVDWKGFDKPFSLDSIPDVLTPDEVVELAVNYRFAVRAQEVDLKKSLRESTSKTKAPASAATSQTDAT